MTAPAFDGSQTGAPIGYYSYTVADDHWFWSDGVYVLHGYASGAVPATTDTLLRHKHPDDRERAFEVLRTAMRDGLPFSCYHRIIDCNGQVRSVLSVGRGLRDQEGQVEEVVGYFVDLTEVRRVETQADVELALVRAMEHRAVIDQAKGVLMFTTGCDADEAFDVLRSYSSKSNLKLSEVARRLVESIGAQLRSPQETSAEVMTYLESLSRLHQLA